MMFELVAVRSKHDKILWEDSRRGASRNSMSWVSWPDSVSLRNLQLFRDHGR